MMSQLQEMTPLVIDRTLYKPKIIPTFLKWAGGKSKLLDTFQKFFPEKIEEYYEPFVGGGAVFFYVKQVFKPKKTVISDVNKDLINVYLQVKNNTSELIKILKQYREKHSRDYYYHIREEFNSEKKPTLRRAANFIYLNKTCFNGLYRENSKGNFNVPIGSYKNPSIFDARILKKASELLQGTIIKCQDFGDIREEISENSFVYLDPPYHPLNGTSKFTSYTKEGFGKREQVGLSQFFEELNKKGSKAMLSNSDTDLIKKLYFNFSINKVFTSRAINCKADGRGRISELVVTNY